MSDKQIKDPLCTLHHCRLAGYCLRSVIKYCSENNFNWKRFKLGVPASELRSFNLLEFTNVANIAGWRNGK